MQAFMERGYYVLRTEKAEEWPYVSTALVAGPFEDEPYGPFLVGERVAYWEGTQWRSLIGTRLLNRRVARAVFTLAGDI